MTIRFHPTPDCQNTWHRPEFTIVAAHHRAPGGPVRDPFRTRLPAVSGWSGTLMLRVRRGSRSNNAGDKGVNRTSQITRQHLSGETSWFRGFGGASSVTSVSRQRLAGCSASEMPWCHAVTAEQMVERPCMIRSTNVRPCRRTSASGRTGRASWSLLRTLSRSVLMVAGEGGPGSRTSSGLRTAPSSLQRVDRVAADRGLKLRPSQCGCGPRARVRRLRPDEVPRLDQCRCLGG